MANSRANFLVKIPIRFWDINKTRQGITFICRTLYNAAYRETRVAVLYYLKWCSRQWGTISGASLPLTLDPQSAASARETHLCPSHPHNGFHPIMQKICSKYPQNAGTHIQNDRTHDHHCYIVHSTIYLFCNQRLQSHSSIKGLFNVKTK